VCPTFCCNTSVSKKQSYNRLQIRRGEGEEVTHFSTNSKERKNPFKLLSKHPFCLSVRR